MPLKSSREKNFQLTDGILFNQTRLFIIALLIALLLHSKGYCAADYAELNKVREMVDSLVYHPAIKAIILSTSGVFGAIHGFYKGGGLTAFITWFALGIVFCVLQTIVAFLSSLGT